MNKSFTYRDGSFYLNDRPYTVISGAIHYFRTLPECWEDRLTKLKACGFNTVETYTCWNLHERREGQFDFSGILDIERFIETAERLETSLPSSKASGNSSTHSAQRQLPVEGIAKH